MQPIRVLLVNHHPIIRSSLRHVLEREPRIQVIAEAASGEEAVQLSQYQDPDVVLLDFQLPFLSGIRTAREIADGRRNMKSLFISVFPDEEYVLEAFKAGASGFVLSAAVQSDLLAAIRVVAGGGIFISPLVSSELVDECNRRFGGGENVIPGYHKQLFCWLAEGLQTDDIAQRLNTTVAGIQASAQDVQARLGKAGMSKTITSLIQAGERS